MAKQAKKRIIDLIFPVAGLHKGVAYQSQPPYTTPDCLNVRPFETIEGRERGGSRPGLSKAFRSLLGSGNPVRMLSSVSVVQSGGLTYWTDAFQGSTLASVWSVPSWIGGSLPDILPEDVAEVSYNTTRGAVRAAIADLNTTAVYQIDLFIVPWNGAHHGTYQIFGRMNNTTPIATTDGFIVTLTMTDAVGTYSGTLDVYVATVKTSYALTGAASGQADAAWLSVAYTPSTANIKVYWNGTQLISQNCTFGGSAGNRVGFGMACSVAGGILLADTFRFQYTPTGNKQVRRTYLIASGNGSIYQEGNLDELNLVSTTLTLASDRNLQATERYQKLYIADNGNPKVTGTDGVITGVAVHDELSSATIGDGWGAIGLNAYDDVCVISQSTTPAANGTYQITGVHTSHVHLSPAPGDTATCSFHFARGPKIYDPVAGTLTLWTATAGKGQVPIGCSLIALYRDRLLLSGDPLAPHVYYGSRAGDPLDFDYAASEDDGARAIGGVASSAGKIGQPVLALMPHSDDYCLLGCKSSLWIMRGDPAYGGQIDCISHIAGVIGAQAWCYGPEGQVLFLSHDGLYTVPPGSQGYAQRLSHERLPQEMLNVDGGVNNVFFAYDPTFRGVHIYVTAKEAAGRRHWWYDWLAQSFWPVTLQTTHDPTALYAMQAEFSEDNAVLLGCRDGYVRRYRNHCEHDDGSAFSSYIMYGGLRIGQGYYDGILDEILLTIGRQSGAVTWAVQVGDDGEAAVKAAAFASGTRTGTGRQHTIRPRARGAVAVLKLSNGASKRRWAVDGLVVTTMRLGRQRLP